MGVGFTQPLTEMSIREKEKFFWEVEHGRGLRLAI
jgi:hypothetical protein